MSGGGQKAPTGYQPAYQPGADQGYIGNVNQIGTAGTNLSNQTVPQLSNLAQNVVNNPYNTQAMTGAQNAANVASNQVAPQQLQSAQQISALTPLAQSYIPATTVPGLQAGAQVLNTGFDPQSSLYNRSFQQMQDQQNAINSMYGVASSPYGAGIAGQAAQNFNIDWQNQQLARQIQALGAWNSAASGAVGNLGSLANTMGGAATTASGLGTQGLNTLATAAQLPADLYNQQQQQGLQALGTQIQDTTGAFGLNQTAAQDLAAYLKLGQGATQNAQQAAQLNNAQQNAMWQGIGSLFGTATEMFAFA
jgi:hypothetical protein